MDNTEYDRLIDRLYNAAVLNPLVQEQPIVVGNGWEVLVFKTYSAIEAYLVQNRTAPIITVETMTMYPGGVSTRIFPMLMAFVDCGDGTNEGVQIKIFKRPQNHPVHGTIVGWTLL